MKIDARHVPCPLRAAALASPEAPAITGAGASLTCSELDRRVSAAAGRFGEAARVGIYLKKDERYVALMLALIRAGAVACPLSTRVPPDGVRSLLGKAGCTALVSEDEELFGVVGSDVRKLRPEELLEDDPAPPGPGPVRIALEQPATIIFTSGSASEPKAVMHTFGNHYHSALGSGANISLAPGDRWLHSLPLYHVGGLSIVFRCLLAGATITLPEPGATIGRAVAESGATHVSLVATQLRRLLKEKATLEGVKAILMGGSAVPHPLLDKAESRGLPVHTSYGLTEMASQVTTTRPGASRRELRTSGRVLPYREVAVAEDGEILVRGKTLFAGYVDGDTLDLPLDESGWFHTSDLGEIDEDGRLTVRGRKDNLFVSGGENVQPEEIEETLRCLDGVEETVVVPVPDAEFGFRPVAFVKMAGEAPPQDLAKALEPVLPRFKIPVAFHRWPENAPRGMKIDRAFFGERARQIASHRK